MKLILLNEQYMRFCKSKDRRNYPMLSEMGNNRRGMLKGGTVGIKFCLNLAKVHMGKYVTGLGYSPVSNFGMGVERMA